MTPQERAAYEFGTSEDLKARDRKREEERAREQAERRKQAAEERARVLARLTPAERALLGL